MHTPSPPPTVPTIPSWDEAVEEVPANETESAPGGRAFHGIQGGITLRLCPNSRDHRENTTGRDTGKTPPTEQVEDAPTDEQEPTCITLVEDDVIELHAGTEDLD